MKPPSTLIDATALEESLRIGIIGGCAAMGAQTTFIVDDDATADRYVARLLEGYPVRVVARMSRPGAGREGGTVRVVIGPACEVN